MSGFGCVLSRRVSFRTKHCFRCLTVFKIKITSTFLRVKNLSDGQGLTVFCVKFHLCTHGVTVVNVVIGAKILIKNLTPYCMYILHGRRGKISHVESLLFVQI